MRTVSINICDVGDPLDPYFDDPTVIFERVVAPLLEDILAVGGVRRITSKYVWINVLMSYVAL